MVYYDLFSLFEATILDLNFVAYSNYIHDVIYLKSIELEHCVHFYILYHQIH